jgi:hypothetical protein
MKSRGGLCRTSPGAQDVHLVEEARGPAARCQVLEELKQAADFSEVDETMGRVFLATGSISKAGCCCYWCCALLMPVGSVHR